jgi:hypothetical protein
MRFSPLAEAVMEETEVVVFKFFQAYEKLFQIFFQYNEFYTTIEFRRYIIVS